MWEVENIFEVSYIKELNICEIFGAVIVRKYFMVEQTNGAVYLPLAPNYYYWRMYTFISQKSSLITSRLKGSKLELFLAILELPPKEREQMVDI